MIFGYSCGIGVPLKNTIVRDGTGGLTTVADSGKECGCSFGSGDGFIKVVSSSLKLRLLFRKCDGVFVGLQYNGNTDGGQRDGDFRLPPFTDGELSINLKGRHVSDKFLYIDLRDDTVMYNAADGIVLYGSFPEDCLVLRVLNNAYVCIDSGGSIGGIFVKLSE